MTTRFRRLMQLREMAAKDDATRRVSDGVSQWHMQDRKNIEPRTWYTENQMLFGMAGAFIAGFGACYALIYVLAME